MSSYTAHDASIVFVKKTLLKWLKKYKFDLDIYPIRSDGIYDEGCFYILIKANKWFPNLAYYVEIKREIVKEMNYSKCKEIILNDNLISYSVPIKSKIIEENF